MGSPTERSFLTLLLAIDTSDRPVELVTTALRALMGLTRARYGRAEIRVLGSPEPLLLVEPVPGPVADAPEAPSRASPRRDLASNRCDTGFATVHLELHSQHRDLPLTYHHLELFDLLFHALARVAKRTAISSTGDRTLHDATREFHEKLVADALHRARGNVSHAARELGVTRAFVYKCMRAASAKSAS